MKTRGYIAVSEVTCFTEERPAEIEEFWNECYPEIETISNKIAQIQNAGYIPIASFILPQECWTKHYFEPLTSVQETFLKKYADNQMAQEFD